MTSKKMKEDLQKYKYVGHPDETGDEDSAATSEFMEWKNMRGDSNTFGPNLLSPYEDLVTRFRRTGISVGIVFDIGSRSNAILEEERN